MEKLILKTGTEIEKSSVIESNENLFIYVENGFNIKQVFDSFYDSEATEKIIYSMDGEESVYEGYNKLVSVRDEGNGLITAVLRK